jgi:transposase-like protein/DNA-directed RNA polymerase subunit RPC12/RpoP
MQHITKSAVAQVLFTRLHLLVLLSFLALALLGQVPESQGGWVACPPRLVVGSGDQHQGSRTPRGPALGERLRCCARYLGRTWPLAVLRSLLLGWLWESSGRLGPVWVVAWPVLLGLWQAAAVGWPELYRWPEWLAGAWLLRQGQRLLLAAGLGLTLGRVWGGPSRAFSARSMPAGPCLGLGCLLCGREEPWVKVAGQEDGGYQAELCGHFTVQVAGDDPFRTRLLLLFLRLLDVPAAHRGSRRTRDGRTPFVRQEQLAQWLGLPQPDISRIERYWLQGDWPNLLSRRTPEVLTGELLRRIVTVLATFPHKGVEQVHAYLCQQGVQVTQRQVRQAAEQSGWSLLRQELLRRYHWTAAAFHFQESWLIQELLGQVQRLLECLEQGVRPATAEILALADLRALAQEAGLPAAPPLKALPWLLRVERVIFGHWEMAADATIRCPECGSTQVARKSRKPRQKKFYDDQGRLQEVAVYRYYCRNRDCPRGSFTHLPAGLVPYSRQRLEVHLLALQAYAWSYSTYRRVGQSLRVSEVTIYRWVSAWGTHLLPVAAIFGVVRSSGVVGVDEKYVLVPKNDKPAGKMRRWMYVYLAVDVYTYDLLHIAIYPHNSRESARAFLLALRSKGYHPRVIVTDLRRDYGPVVAQVFAQAQHHECIFHAQQDIGRYLWQTLGAHYAERHPQAQQLQTAVERIFQARTKRTAQKRYEELWQGQQDYVQAEPTLQWVFDFLEQHWPHLVNAVESTLIPATNNAVETVIRRFDQHYQNFCGFESIGTAQVYLGVFEKVYRFTPFSDDARPEIRGRSPLELAGYDLSQLPMPWLCRGYSLEWPIMQEAQDAVVPNS